jgi:hypothetical protein
MLWNYWKRKKKRKFSSIQFLAQQRTPLFLAQPNSRPTVRPARVPARGSSLFLAPLPTWDEPSEPPLAQLTRVHIFLPSPMFTSWSHMSEHLLLPHTDAGFPFPNSPMPNPPPYLSPSLFRAPSGYISRAVHPSASISSSCSHWGAQGLGHREHEPYRRHWGWFIDFVTSPIS